MKSPSNEKRGTNQQNQRPLKNVASVDTRPANHTPQPGPLQMRTAEKSASLEVAYQRLERAGYPFIFAQNSGFRYFLDAAGLLDGVDNFGPHKGQRRAIAPYAKPGRDEVNAVVDWFASRPLLGQKSPTITSYQLKHLARESLGRYVSNGSMILAIDCCGLAQHVAASGEPELNTIICVSRRSLKHLSEVKQ